MFDILNGSTLKFRMFMRYLLKNYTKFEYFLMEFVKVFSYFISNNNTTFTKIQFISNVLFFLNVKF